MIMAYKHSHRLMFVCRVIHLNITRCAALYSNPMLYHCTEDSFDDQERLPADWYEKAFPKIKKLSSSLKNVDLIDGRLVNVNDDSTILDERIEQRMRIFKSLVRVFIGSPSVQRRVTEMAASTATNWQPQACFRNSSEREPMVVDSLTKVSNFLNVSAQQRKLVRHTICPQATQHHIWTGALDHVLKELKMELDPRAHHSPNEGIKMGQQIVSSCLNFLNDATNSNTHITSWMRPAPLQRNVDSSTSPKWEDMLEMFTDLIGTLKDEKGLHQYVTKLEVMKEGLTQIRDVLTDKSIGFKEAKHQESLVQKKLSKTLGHSSRCLFTLLLYYLFGHFRDVEVDLCGGLLKAAEKEKYLVFMGRILSCDEERVVWNGVRQLDRAMGLFKFVWETAGMKGDLVLQGHLFCVGAEDSRQLSYKGNVYLLHQISL
ncbi:uncharacterized protein LOC111788189 [Cucurbita pepo subsp. pepo]|uniref:uncharacterized protein LOC111788189 n=1 Tax=Cucurbita pepo subsp. pepo TaxID=3664 RepID=UPI000C9D9FAC|nr:uncharacterized protein LOC111788189 [Cucurbita pepo subsp. pepo]